MMAIRRRSDKQLLLIAAVMLGAHAVHAQPASSSGHAEKEAAEHDKRAFAALKRVDAEGARLEFLQSYALLPTQRTLWNLLVAEADSNRPLDALKHLRTYLVDPHADPKKKEHGKELLTELTSRVGHVQIDVSGDETVTVDGVALTREERKSGIDVAPGKHTVEAVIGNEPRRIDIDAPAGKVSLVTFDSPPAPLSGPIPPVAPPSPLASSSPSFPSSRPIERTSGGLGAPPTATWILGGVAVAALGTGITFSLMARSKRDDLGNDFSACAVPDSEGCARLHDLKDAADRHVTIAWIGYGVSGAAAVAGGLVWLFSSGSSSSSKRAVARATNIVPLTAPNMAGVRLQTSF